MNYSKSLNKKSIAKRLMTSWVIIAVVSLVIGLFVGCTVKGHITAKEDTKIGQGTIGRVSDDFAVYGAYDDRIMTEEIPLDWEVADHAYKAYDVKMLLTDQQYLYYLCKGYDLDFSLMVSVINVESDFNRTLVSSTDDYGLMQINKMNHAELKKILGVTDFLDPEQNMRAGCYIFRKLFEKYQEPNLVLMAYNMGETGAKRLWREGIYETEYTQKVFAAQKTLQERD